MLITDHTSVDKDNKLIVMLDASATKESSCSLRLFNTVIGGYTGKVQSNDIEFGSAFHKFKARFKMEGKDGFATGIREAQHYFNTTPMYVKPQKKYLDSAFLVNACIGYVTKYENDSFKVVSEDGKPFIELPFCFPIYVDDLVEILACGTIDEIGKFQNGIYSIEDLKTTSMWNVDEYLESYRLSPQLYFYRWTIRQYALAKPNSLMATIDQSEVGCHISGVFFKGKDKEIEYRRGDVMLFKEKEIKEFEILLNRTIVKLVEMAHDWIKDGTLPLREGMLNGACSTVYGPCKFACACGTTDETTRDIVMQQSFIQRFYDPLSFGGHK